MPDDRVEETRQEEKGQEEDDDSLSVLLTHVYREMSRAFAQNAGMSFSRFLILHELMHSGEISQSDLQRRIGMEGALLTRFAKQMEASGLIGRRVDPADNRYTLVSLTPTGKRVLTEMRAPRKAREFQLTRGLSKKEVEDATRAIKRILKNFAESRE